MNRRKFIKESIAGIAVGVAGSACGPEGNASNGGTSGGGVGGPAVAEAATENNVIRLALSKSTVPPAAWDDAVALITVAREVLSNPNAAERFSQNPTAYLTDHALGHVQLNPEAAEVKIALALGDPDVRDAVARQDVRQALAALERRGLLSVDRADGLPGKLEALYRANPSLAAIGNPGTDMMPILVVLIWIAIVAVQDIYVAVAAIVYLELSTQVLVSVDTVGVAAMESLRQQKVIARSPGLQAAAILGGAALAGEITDAWISDTTEKAASVVEGLDHYRAAPIDPAKLRNMIRSTVQTYLQQ